MICECFTTLIKGFVAVTEKRHWTKLYLSNYLTATIG
nr:MAG TPA: hypothetical protein [Caudoviricetes sp.]